MITHFGHYTLPDKCSPLGQNKLFIESLITERKLKKISEQYSKSYNDNVSYPYSLLLWSTEFIGDKVDFEGGLILKVVSFWGYLMVVLFWG